MEYQYSSIVDPTTYETEGLCEGIPLRCHHNPEFEEIETLRCQEDWREWVGPLGFYKGGLGPRWNFMAITVPECLPERLGVLGYANELAFLHDDVTDVASMGDIHNNDLMVAFEQGAEMGKIENSASGKRAIQAKIAREMLALNKEQAITTMKAWAKFAELGSGRQHQTHFKTEEEYIDYRMIDIGTMFWYGMVTFGMGISIPEYELDTCHELATIAYLNLGLTNDLYSWQKEYETAIAMGQDHVVNVISVLMEEHSISEAEAKDLCRDKIKQTIVDFRKIVKDTNAREDISIETKRYLEALLYSLSGNLVWSLECPRYHTWAKYNDQQLDWMKNGIPKELKYPTNGTAAHKDDMQRPASNGVVNGLTNGVVKGTTNSVSNGSHKLTNGTNGIHETRGPNHHSPNLQTTTNGTLEDSLVNVFVTEKADDLNGMKLDDRRTISPEFQPNLTDLDVKAIQAPYDYISALPSKGVREQAIEAINVWCRVPQPKLEKIKSITQILHSASLMLDDLEDGSNLRRGRPSTHTIFGEAQTVNSANFQIIRALEEAQSLGDAESVQVFIDELKCLYVGQSLDLYWTNNMICPSVDEYFKMVECKTGGLFRLFGKLMTIHSTNPVAVDLSDLLSDFGRYFQTRDDYQNLVSAEYTEQKGFCEDLDEGKYSLPLIHLMQSMSSDYLLRNILTQRRLKDKSTLAHKQTILAMMKKCGSLQYTADMLNGLHIEVERKVGELEGKYGAENFQLRLILDLLKI